MNARLFTGMIALIAISACTSKKDTNSNDAVDVAVTEPVTDMSGKWDIKSIVLNDSISVIPENETPGNNQYVTFEDSTFFIQTNCNTFNGGYRIAGDSISFDNAICTEMACDNMAVEDALRKCLHGINKVTVENDSVVRLVGNTASEYILLQKSID